MCWVGVASPRQFLPCLPAAFSLWDGLSQLDQPQRGIRRWCDRGGIAPSYPWGNSKLWGEWVRAGAEAQSCPEHLPLGITVKNQISSWCETGRAGLRGCKQEQVLEEPPDMLSLQRWIMEA